MSKEVSVQELFASLPNVGNLVKFDVRTGTVCGTVVAVTDKAAVVESALGGVMYPVPFNKVRPL